MKPGWRRLIFLFAGIACVVLLILASSTYWDHQQLVFQDTTPLIAAMQAFSRDQILQGRQLPAEISLQDLIQGGYLRAKDVRAFEGMEVTFSTRYDPTTPHRMVARARTADGQLICLMGDGSVQQFSPQKYEQYRDGLRQSSDFVPSSTTTNTSH
jgi:hypothetical protein